jgi:hypothetical protein
MIVKIEEGREWVLILMDENGGFDWVNERL